MSKTNQKLPVSIKAEAWGSRVGLVLAMAGNAVGFGNFLRFPVQAVQNGGGAFIIPYLVSLVILGLPLLLIEWSSGRYGGQFGHHSTPFIMHSLHRGRIWKYVGVFGIFCNIAIAAYYCYMESWTMSYVYHSVAGTFNGLSQHDVAGFFSQYLDVTVSTTGIPFEAILFFVLCLALNTWILSKGLSAGVEKTAKIGVPLLILFGVFLAWKGINLTPGEDGAVFGGSEGLNFLWTPNYDSLANPKVWLAAAGQIFFTLSVGMGSIQCYASYLKKNEDVACNAMSAGFMNEFVEIVLGSAIVIPIAIGYLGIDRVVDLTGLGGLGLAFRTMPFLFEQWGPVLSALAGVAFFGLLFFAGITSSLAMGTPIVGFLQDEFKWRRKPAAMTFGLIILFLGLPTVLFFQQGVFDEYDYWAGTVSLVVFAMFEAILFAWFFGMKKGWAEINRGADIKVPLVFKYLLQYVTPVVLIVVFVSSLLRPANDDWSKISLTGWPLHPESIIGKLIHKEGTANPKYFADRYYSELDGKVDSVWKQSYRYYVQVIPAGKTHEFAQTFTLDASGKLLISKGDQVIKNQPLYEGRVINRIFFVDMSRLLLLALFLGISLLVHIAYTRRKKENSI
ncbi:MAG: sodium-dependent transporter [Bacteroidales bacterium]|nr:sodium-dependent transporter [Bacteroidales bacterium]MDD3664453.1 sodium-dependent transporter [Bacteroidales bacterium]